MPQIVDMAKVEEDIARFRAVVEPRFEMPGIRGMLARSQAVISVGMTRWRAEEMNRGSTPNEIANIMVLNFAAAFQSHVTTFTDDRTEQLATINRMLKALGEEIAKIRVGATATTNFGHGWD